MAKKKSEKKPLSKAERLAKQKAADTPPRVLPSDEQTKQTISKVSAPAPDNKKHRARTTIMFDKVNMKMLAKHFAGEKISVSDYIEQAVNEKLKRDKGIKYN